MMQVDPRPDSSTTDLVREALVEAKELLQVEVALARDEMTQEINRVKRSAIALGAAVGAGVLGVAMVLVAIALAISPGPMPALLIGLSLLVLAVILGVLGYGNVPKQPLVRTRSRLSTDARLLKEHVA
jgi:VIT1/CCC1 family predicted Fe2+/Mn2+ transporter